MMHCDEMRPIIGEVEVMIIMRMIVMLCYVPCLQYRDWACYTPEGHRDYRHTKSLTKEGSDRWCGGSVVEHTPPETGAQGQQRGHLPQL